MNRTILLLSYLIILQGLLSFRACSQSSRNGYYLLVGTYTSNGSEGIYTYKFNTENGAFGRAGVAANVQNPSFLAIGKDNRHVYAVNENKGEGSVVSFRFSDGQLQALNSQPSAGIAPCYVAVDKSGKWLAVGNYVSGSFLVYPIKSDGSLGDPVHTGKHLGKSVNSSRQEGPHVHATVFSSDNRLLFVPDLGTDKVMIYSFDEKTGSVTPARQPFAASVPGSGPRHFEFHPNDKYAYLMEELSGTVSVFAYNKNGNGPDGILRLIQNISSHPDGYKGVIGSADIHVSPDGDFLYASNRGESNTIAIFSIDKKTGKLSPVGHQSTLGIKPRNFTIDPSGKFLLVANQETGNIVIFRIDKKTGKLSALKDQIRVPDPVCLKFVKMK